MASKCIGALRLGTLCSNAPLAIREYLHTSRDDLGRISGVVQEEKGRSQEVSRARGNIWTASKQNHAYYICPILHCSCSRASLDAARLSCDMRQRYGYLGYRLDLLRDAVPGRSPEAEATRQGKPVVSCLRGGLWRVICSMYFDNGEIQKIAFNVTSCRHHHDKGLFNHGKDNACAYCKARTPPFLLTALHLALLARL